jgi:hypothetical protein
MLIADFVQLDILQTGMYSSLHDHGYGMAPRSSKSGQRPQGEGLTGSIVVSGTPCGAIMKTNRRAGSVVLAFFETI